MFINISNQLPKTSYIKMMDVWLIFNLCLPFSEVLLHTYKVSRGNHWRTLIYFIFSKDYLRDEDREVNHHGRVRKIGEEDENDEENEIEVMKNNWVGNTGQLELDLISRREDVQVCILFFILQHLALHYRLLHWRNTTGICLQMRRSLVELTSLGSLSSQP